MPAVSSGRRYAFIIPGVSAQEGNTDAELFV